MFHGNKGSSAAWPGILNWPCRILPSHGPDGWSPGTIFFLRIELCLTHIILNHLGCWKEMQALKLGRQSSPDFIPPWAMLGQHLNAKPSEYWLGYTFHSPVCLFILDLHPPWPCWANYLFFFPTFNFFIGVQLINNVVIVSNEQQRDSAKHIHVSILSPTPLPSRLPH